MTIKLFKRWMIILRSPIKTAGFLDDHWPDYTIVLQAPIVFTSANQAPPF